MTRTVSVIIPNYNNAKYLADCINSVRTQTYSDLEIIVIDGQSADGSVEIIRELAAADPRIVYKSISREGGVGASRNLGIETAKGGYIMFLDSDDMMCPPAIEEMMTIQSTTGADVVSGGYTRVPECFYIPGGAVFPPPGFGFEFYDSVYEYNRAVDAIGFVVVWGKLFRRELVQSARFLTGVHPHEDTDFMLRLYARTKSVAVTRTKVVYYRRSLTAVTRKKGPDQSGDVMKMMSNMSDFIKSGADCGRKYARFLREYLYYFLDDYAAKARRNENMSPRLAEVLRHARRLGLFCGGGAPLLWRVRLMLLGAGRTASAGDDDD